MSSCTNHIVTAASGGWTVRTLRRRTPVVEDMASIRTALAYAPADAPAQAKSAFEESRRSRRHREKRRRAEHQAG